MTFPDLLRCPYFSYDTETTGLNPMAGDRVFGFSITLPDYSSFYYDVRETPSAIEWVNDVFRNFKGTVVCHNLSFDYRMSKATGIHLPLTRCVDTCIQAGLINEHEFSYSLDNLARKYTNVSKSGQELYDNLAQIFGGRATKNVQMKNIAKAPSDIVGNYAKDDTIATLKLYEYQEQEIKKQKLEKIVEFESRLTPVLIESEMFGVRVDINEAEQAVGALSEQVKVLQKELNDIAGFHCNPQSASKDIHKLFKPKWKEGRWWAIDGTPLESTGSGNASLGADMLRKMSHPASDVILELRSVLKTRDTFLVGHVLESAQNGRVYPTINQSKGEDGGTGTGRLSYTTPALQQIPDRNKKVAQIVKKCFLPEEGHKWVDTDKASFEVRIFGHLINDPAITEKFKNEPETDFHGFVAELTGLPRDASYVGEPNAKKLNLAMIFNQGNGSTAEAMGMPWEWDSFIPKDSKTGKPVVYQKAGSEAMKVINKYHETLRGVKKLADGCKRVAEQRGYIFTRMGRHLRFPNGYKTYKASGLLIQSTSADENKASWLYAHEAIEGTESKMLLNTHDSYSFSIPEDEPEKTARDIKSSMERDRGLRVPLILEVQGAGNNWWESKSSKRWM